MIRKAIVAGDGWRYWRFRQAVGATWRSRRRIRRERTTSVLTRSLSQNECSGVR